MSKESILKLCNEIKEASHDSLEDKCEQKKRIEKFVKELSMYIPSVRIYSNRFEIVIKSYCLDYCDFLFLNTLNLPYSVHATNGKYNCDHLLIILIDLTGMI